MKKLTHDTIYNEAIQQAEEDFRNSDGREMKEKCPYIFTSNMADAYWITAYCLYHTGQKPRLLHKSRGDHWKGDFHGIGNATVKVMHPDQREGIIGL